MKNRMLMSLLVIALAAALVGGATMAWFTDAADTDEVTFQAGTLMVDVDDSALAERFETLQNLNPGDCFNFTVPVENIGTKSANWFFYICWQDIVGQLNENLTSEMRADLVTKGYGDKGLSEVLQWTVKVGESIMYTGKIDNAPQVINMSAMDAGETVNVDITACLPGEETNNAYQGAAMDLVFGVKAWQTTNEAPAATAADIKCP